jgi:CHAD domain-containing protein
MITHENTLTERERHILTALAANSEPTTARRAQALLEWSQGRSDEEIAEAAGLRRSRIKHLTRAFAQKRLEVFAPSSIERASRGVEGCITVEALLQKQHADVAHAHYVASLALQLFDATAAVHQLAAGWRELLETGALLHNIGSAEHDDNRHRAGRDIILAHELEGFSPRDRDVLALLALFHRKKVKAPRDPIFAALDQESQHATLVLAAILRVADGLDYSQTQSTRIDSIKVDTLVDAIVAGPHAETDAARANEKADLWRQVLSPPFNARVAGQAVPARTRRKPTKPKTGISSHEPITRAGRKVVAQQFARLQSLEDQVRKGDNVDAVHDMRVATRRMRSAFRLLGKFYPQKTVRRLHAPLRELAGDLGAVRDLDVLIENLRGYIGTLSLEQQRALDPLLADWQARRARAQRTLVEFLDGKRYDDWLGRLENFVEAQARRESPRVADVVPALIWKRYGAVREYETQVKPADLQTLHQLRIECKRLRYALEFFAEALGEETAILLEPLIALQDHIGSLHDANMASQLITEFIAARARYAERHGVANANFEGVAGYLNALQGRMNELQLGFPERWQVVVKPTFRQKLGEAVAAM